MELYGSALVTNTYLKIALALVSLVALGLVVLNFHTVVDGTPQIKPLVIRIDDVGRAEAVQYDATGYQPQPPELRYFLTQFIVKHFSRLRATIQREYPDSLLFLEPALADATIAQNEQSRVIETFLTNPSADEVDIVVQNVSLSELAKAPYKASVSFQKLLYSPGTRQERARQTFIAQIDFALRDRVPNEFVRVNPLGSPDHVLPRGSGLRGRAAQWSLTSPFLAALTTFLAVAWLAGELSFLAPFKAGLFRHHGLTIGVAITVLFLNLCAAYYGIARWLFLRDAGPKARAHGPATRVARRRAERPPAGLSSHRGSARHVAGHRPS